MTSLLIRQPDNPSLVSVDFLRRIDAEPPGTWLAQPKLDGRRRTIWKLNGKYDWRAKDRDQSADVPPQLKAEFESIPWPDNSAFDCEWMGLRSAILDRGGSARHAIYIFDLLALDGEYLGRESFDVRYNLLTRYLLDGHSLSDFSRHVHLVPCWSNPGLVDYYFQQLQDPESEGLVVRRADSGLVGNPNHCADNPYWFKIKYRKNVRRF